MDRTELRSFSKLLEVVQYAALLKPEEQFGVVFDDCYVESTGAEVIDLAFGAGLEYINIKGIKGTEKLCKVLRYAEILDEINEMQAA